MTVRLQQGGEQLLLVASMVGAAEEDRGTAGLQVCVRIPNRNPNGANAGKRVRVSVIDGHALRRCRAQ